MFSFLRRMWKRWVEQHESPASNRVQGVKSQCCRRVTAEGGGDTVGDTAMALMVLEEVASSLHDNISMFIFIREIA